MHALCGALHACMLCSVCSISWPCVQHSRYALYRMTPAWSAGFPSSPTLTLPPCVRVDGPVHCTTRAAAALILEGFAYADKDQAAPRQLVHQPHRSLQLLSALDGLLPHPPWSGVLPVSEWEWGMPAVLPRMATREETIPYLRGSPALPCPPLPCPPLATCYGTQHVYPQILARHEHGSPAGSL